MDIKRIRHRLAVLGVSIILSSCGSTAPPISEADILKAERNGTLLLLYDQVRQGEGQGRKLKPADRDAYLKRIGNRLAMQLSQQNSAMINQQRLTTGQVPLAVLNQQAQAIEAMRTWDSQVFQTSISQIQQERANTEQAIDDQQGQYDGLAIQEITTKHQIIVQLQLLYGDADQGQLQQMLQQLLLDNNDWVDQLVGDRQFDQAIQQLQQMVTIDPDFEGISDKLHRIERTATQDSFIQYVKDGETNKATQLLEIMANGQYFAEQKAKIMPAALELADYYVAMGVEATGEEDILKAYRLFIQSRHIKSKLGKQTEVVGQEADFIDYIYSLYEQATNKQLYGVAMGYLAVIAQLDPNFPEIDSFQRAAWDKVMDLAVKRISTTQFSGDEQHAALGRSIASRITQFVFDTLPTDIKVVEREQLDAVMREQEINALSQGSEIRLDSADLLIQGTILEANIETERNESKKRVRVVTERQQVANPAYQQWLALSTSKREKSPQPTATILKEKKEDIVIGVTHIRKVALLSISYRIVDAKSAEVLYADSVVEKKKVADETTEGVELGEFTAPFKMANLPSDPELMSDLTRLLSKRIGGKVVELLKDPEDTYTQQAKKAATQRNYVNASQQLAKALVLSKSKRKPTAELTDLLREYAMTSQLEE